MEASNLQELKEATEELIKFCRNSCSDRYCEDEADEEGWGRAPSLCSAISRARKAINANPIRQCDVGTPEEQSERMEKAVCSKHHGCVRCPLRKAKYSDCSLGWAQTPYAEEGGAA